MSDAEPPVVFVDGPTLQPGFVDLVLDAAIPSAEVREFLRANLRKSGQQFESLDQVFGMLRGFLAGNLETAMKESPLGGINVDLLEQAAHLARYEERFLAEAKRYQTDDKPNPDAVFWPNPVHPTHARPLIGAIPHTGNHGLVDKSTAIGSAGSCFASEIAYYLQRQGYNYVVTESDPRDGELPESSACWGIILAQFAIRRHCGRIPLDTLWESERWITSAFGTGSRVSMS